MISLTPITILLAAAQAVLANPLPTPVLIARQADPTADASGITIVNLNTTSSATSNQYQFCSQDEFHTPLGNLYAIVGSYQTDTKRYWGVCWDLTALGSNTKFDQAFADEAIDFLAYFTQNANPTAGARQTTVKDQSPNVSGARANRWLDIFNGHIDPWDAQDIVKALVHLGANGDSLLNVDFTTTYGVLVSSLTKDANGVYKPHGTNIQFCGKENLCTYSSSNTDLAPTFLPDNAAVGFDKYAWGTCTLNLASANLVSANVNNSGITELDSSAAGPSPLTKFYTGAYATISDGNGFEIGWTDGPGGWVAFDQSTYPVEISNPSNVLPHTVFIHPGAHPVTDPASIQYGDQTVPCTLAGKDGSNLWDCEASFQCPQKVTNSNGFTPGTCSIVMSQTNQTATQSNPNETVQPASSDNIYIVSVVVIDAQGNGADSVTGTVAGDKNPLVLQGKLPKSLRVTPEIQGDYVQFEYDTQQWKTTTMGGSPGCHATEWVPDVAFPGFPHRAIQCKFEC